MKTELCYVCKQAPAKTIAISVHYIHMQRLFETFT